MKDRATNSQLQISAQGNHFFISLKRITKKHESQKGVGDLPN